MQLFSRPFSATNLLSQGNHGGDYPFALGRRLTLWLDYTDDSETITKKGVRTVHVPSAANTTTNGCTFLTAPVETTWDYRTIGTGLPSPTKPRFSVILNYVPYDNMFSDTATVNEHIMCSYRVNMGNTAGGWCLYAHKVGTDWFLGCYFSGLAADGVTAITYKCRSSESIAITANSSPSNVGMSWNPDATAGNRLKIYINGVEATKNAITGFTTEPTFANSTQWSTNVFSGPAIGWWYGHGTGYSTIVNAPMIVKGFTYWQEELSAAQFLSYYNDGITRSASDIVATFNPARHWSFEQTADGTATGATNQHLDSVAGSVITPRQGTTAGVWLGTERPAKSIWVAERINNKAWTGGYIGLHGGNAIEYRRSGVTVDSPEYGSRLLRLNSVKGQRTARLVGPSLVDVVDHTDGVVMYCVRQDTYHASEDFDIGVVTRETGVTTPGSPNSYCLFGHGVYLGTLRSPMVRTENAAATIGGAYIPTTLASPSTGVAYLITVLKIGGSYWFRRTDLSTGTAVEQTTLTGSNTLAGFWWPSTLTSQGKSYEILNMYGHVFAANNPKQYFGQCLVARNVTYNEMLTLERFVKLNL